MLSYTDHFGVSDGEIRRAMEAALSRGASYCDIYFQHTVENQIVMEEGIVKEGLKWIAHGAGIRAVKGEGTGYAYTEDLSPEMMRKAALTAAAIADSGASPPPEKISEVGYENRYPVDDPLTGSALEKKIALIEEAEAAARKYDPRIIKVTVTLADSLSTIQIATSEGRLLRDTRPMVRISVSAVA